jgi:hypothetical protein
MGQFIRAILNLDYVRDWARWNTNLEINMKVLGNSIKKKEKDWWIGTQLLRNIKDSGKMTFLRDSGAIFGLKEKVIVKV